MTTKAFITNFANSSLDYAMRRSLTASTSWERGDLEDVISLLISPIQQYMREHLVHMPTSTYQHLAQVMNDLYAIQEDMCLAPTTSKQQGEISGH